MSAYLGLLQQTLFFGFVTATLIAACIAVAYPRVAKYLRPLSPGACANFLSLLCVLPVFATAALLLAALLPSMLEVFDLSTDHCEGHSEGHLHFCLVHLPPLVANAVLLLAAGAGLAALAWMFVQVLKDVFTAAKFRAMLRAHPVASRLETATVLDSALPLAFSCGFLRPQVFLSTGLLQTLTEEERAMVLAHEESHARRYDSIRLLLARALSVVYLPRTRSVLLGDLQLACEQASDAAAARASGNAAGVAALLLKIERLYHPHFAFGTPLVPGVLGTTASSLPARITVLLEPAATRPASISLPACWILLAVLLLAVHDGVHDGLEHVLAIVTGIGQ